MPEGHGEFTQASTAGTVYPVNWATCCVLNTRQSSTVRGTFQILRCPDFRGCSVHKQSVWDSEMCPVY